MCLRRTLPGVILLLVALELLKARLCLAVHAAVSGQQGAQGIRNRRGAAVRRCGGRLGNRLLRLQQVDQQRRGNSHGGRAFCRVGRGRRYKGARVTRPRQAQRVLFAVDDACLRHALEGELAAILRGGGGHERQLSVHRADSVGGGCGRTRGRRLRIRGHIGRGLEAQRYGAVPVQLHRQHPQGAKLGRPGCGQRAQAQCRRQWHRQRHPHRIPRLHLPANKQTYVSTQSHTQTSLKQLVN